MPSKGMRGQPCVYCADGLSTKQGDHVLARQLVLEPHRGGLPKVPACSACNHTKSEYEAYVSAVLPFGGRHSGAVAALVEVARRLANNLRLARDLRSGYAPAVDHAGPFSVALTSAVPFDAGKLEALAAMMARGLAQWHWRVRLGVEFAAEACSVTEPGDALLAEKLLGMNGERVVNEIGGGAFAYEALRSTTEPHLSIWRMLFYGGAVGVAEDGSRSRAVWAFLGRKAPVQKLMEAIG